MAEAGLTTATLGTVPRMTDKQNNFATFKFISNFPIKVHLGLTGANLPFQRSPCQGDKIQIALKLSLLSLKVFACNSHGYKLLQTQP